MTTLTKQRISTILMFLMLAVSAIIVPIASSQTKEPSYAYVYTSPAKVIQVNQSMIIGAFVQPPPAFVRNYNYTFTITHPDGQTETKLIPESQVDATAGFTYVPTKLGNYSVVMSWPGDTVREAVTSSPTTFTVQQEPL